MQMPKRISITELHKKGVLKAIEEHDKREAEKLGILRCGNAGAADADEVIGSCVRKTYLRALGIEIPEEDDVGSKELMFESGRGNEDLWKAVLQRSYEGCIKCEEEIPVSFRTAQDVEVTGRPDIVLMALDNPNCTSHALELKLICSQWTAIKILNSQPKTNNICQAGIYSLLLNCPIDLVYTSRVYWHIMADWIIKKLPKAGSDGSQYVAYKTTKDKKTGAEVTTPFKINPFIKVFSIYWEEQDDGDLVLCYKEDTKDEPVRTIITKNSIFKFYDLAGAMLTGDDNLPPAPTTLSATGEEGGYSDCDYCPLDKLCKKYKGKSVKEWTAKVNDFIEKQQQPPE